MSKSINTAEKITAFCFCVRKYWYILAYRKTGKFWIPALR